MKTRIFLSVSLSLLPLAACAGDGTSAVPDRFLGHWAGSPESCASEADDLILRIAPRHITHWESEGPIKAVVVRGHSEMALICELSGEGETWLSTVKFTLSPDGRRLIDNTTVPGGELVRYRCADTAGTRPGNASVPAPLHGAVQSRPRSP